MSERQRIKIAISTILVLVVVLTGCKVEIGSDGTWIDNYDYHQGKIPESQRFSDDLWVLKNADWPVTMIFVGPGANVDRVTQILDDAGGDTSGGKMLSRGGKGDFRWWRTNGGRKDTKTSHFCFPINRYTYIHARLYARLDLGYTPTSLGNIVAATTHYDMREHCPSEEFGWSEEASLVWADQIHCAGYNITFEHFEMHNKHDFGMKAESSKHFWSSSGWAHRIFVPISKPSPRSC